MENKLCLKNCNMKNLVSHIQYLLTQHDCVIVPGWGAMIVQHTSALVEADNTLTPPRKWISFNPLLSHNDGILAHSVMRAMQCNYAQAMKFIEQDVASWRKILQTEKSVEWQGIGRFDLEQNNSIIFVESNESIVNVALTILKPIELPLLVDVLSLHSEENCCNGCNRLPYSTMPMNVGFGLFYLNILNGSYIIVKFFF